MSQKIREVILLCCAAGVGLLATAFYSRPEKVEVDVPLVTVPMVREYQNQLQTDAERRQNEEAARQRAEQEKRMLQCQNDDDCIIVDKDPCGCLIGPKGVTVINAGFALEFSRLVEKSFSQAKACPDEASTEKECSSSARGVCKENRCTIVY